MVHTKSKKQKKNCLPKAISPQITLQLLTNKTIIDVQLIKMNETKYQQYFHHANEMLSAPHWQKEVKKRKRDRKLIRIDFCEEKERL